MLKNKQKTYNSKFILFSVNEINFNTKKNLEICIVHKNDRLYIYYEIQIDIIALFSKLLNLFTK